MKLAASDGFSQDEEGQWWYQSTYGRAGRAQVFTCCNCGELTVTYPGKGTQQHCSRGCAQRCKNAHDWSTRRRRERLGATASPRWSGGRILRRGYVFIYAPDHPSIAGRGTTRKYIPEHRLVMEKMLGRYLQPGESVHHKNGIKDDNREENLELWTVSQPPGQRQSDVPHCPTCTCGRTDER